MNDKPEHLWENIAKVVDNLQSKLASIEVANDLFQELLEIDPLPGITKEELSIVYRDYETGTLRTIVEAGRVIDDKHAPNSLTENNDVKKALSAHLQPEKYPMFNIQGKENTANSFDGFSSAFIVPMQLGNGTPPVGAFVLRRTCGKPDYNHTTVRVISTLSNRLANLLDTKNRLREYDALFHELRNELQVKIIEGEIEKEESIIEAIINKLKDFYKDDEFYFLVRNPFDEKTYYLANNHNKLINHDFRSSSDLLLKSENLHAIVGSPENLRKMIGSKSDPYNGEFFSVSGRSNEARYLDNNCKSWLGSSVYYSSGELFGHIVFHYREEARYTKNDKYLLDAVADFTGLLIGSFRIKNKTDFIAELMSSQEESRDSLYKKTSTYFKKLYGVTGLRIWTNLQYNADSEYNAEWGCAWPSRKDNNGIEVEYEENYINSIQNEVSRWVEKSNIGKLPKKDKYLLVPMRITLPLDKDKKSPHDVVGCLGISIGESTSIISDRAHAIFDIADALGRRLDNIHSEERYASLTNFVNKVSCLSSDNLTQEKVLNFAKDHISKVMFSKNLYIALYDEAENTIFFPLIYRKGNIWEEMHNKKRKIDPAKLGRTEVIIQDKKPLLIKTKDDSLAWYAEPNHKDHADEPLASWIGVPMFSASEEKEYNVRGVIATYHDELDYVYSIRDVFFLQNVAGVVAGLFRLLENRDLKEAKNKIELEKDRQIEIIEIEAQRNSEEVRKNISYYLTENIAPIVAERVKQIETSLLKNKTTQRLF